MSARAWTSALIASLFLNGLIGLAIYAAWQSAQRSEPRTMHVEVSR